jgi:nitrogen fixation protein FixH
MKRFSPWPFAIVGLLVTNAALAFFALYMSRSDGGAQVVPDYYQRAVAWDSVASIRNQTRQTGWHLRVIDASSADSLILQVTDVDGTPVEGISGTITVTRPHLTTSIATVEVVAVPGQGIIVAPVRLTGRGLFDAEADLTDGRTRFRPIIRFDRQHPAS